MSDNDRYIVKAVVRAAAVLWSFRSETEVLSLADITRRTGLRKGLVFRMLHTLERCGMVDRFGTHGYRSNVVGDSARRRPHLTLVEEARRACN